MITKSIFSAIDTEVKNSINAVLDKLKNLDQRTMFFF